MEELKCRLASAGICARQSITGCGEVPAVKSSIVVDERVVLTGWNSCAVETTTLNTLCDGSTATQKLVGPDYPNLSSGQVI